jgi:hypothetical protein
MFTLLLAFVGALALTAHAKYDQYILAPESRTIYPSSVYTVNGTVDNAESLASSSPGSAKFLNWASVAYDHGKNIGGLITFTVGSTSDAEQFIGIGFSESSLWISGNWSDATADAGNDELLWWKITGPGQYTVERRHERGGFRYLTLVHNSTGSVEVTQIRTHFTAVPHFADDQLRNYTGWFNSDGNTTHEENVLPMY